MKRISLENIKDEAKNIKVGEEIYLCGKIFTARDAAHKKFFEILDNNQDLPIDINGASIYYAGPTPPPKNNPAGLCVGACGPTTSKRMDYYTPRLLNLGLACIVGKGARSPEVLAALKENGAVYFAAIGGAGAIYAKHIKSAKIAAFEELGCESVRELCIEDFPVYAVYDFMGGDLYNNK